MNRLLEFFYQPSLNASTLGSSLKSETIKSNDLGFGSNQAAVTNSEFFEAICCRRGGGHLRECFSVRQHWFRPYLEKMAAEGALTLDDGNLMSMFSCSENYFSNRYSKYVIRFSGLIVLLKKHRVY